MGRFERLMAVTFFVIFSGFCIFVFGFLVDVLFSYDVIMWVGATIMGVPVACGVTFCGVAMFIDVFNFLVREMLRKEEGEELNE